MLHKGDMDGLEGCLGNYPAGLAGVHYEGVTQRLEGGAGGCGLINVISKTQVHKHTHIHMYIHTHIHTLVSC